MKVILKEDVRKLGKKNAVVEVSDGYARNFLFPRGLAVEGTAQNVNILRDKTAAAERRDLKLTAEAEAVKAKIAGKVIKMSVGAGEGGRLFGSVTAAQVAEALEAQYGVKLDKKNVKIDGAVKALGAYPLTLKLYAGVECAMTLSVEGQQ
ncbi:50S ribosomal protein L9 [Pyramidobacter piscolens]|uniref:Large ribosomal subunit protein bL9 n=1 Tax=Pyramidobacter piscolens W5455 TaxID=352165 RepID=A0ABM9ZX83_9BACT|nr:50S ribosomal protein L9 [Pyramidobacter piscolens]EFB91595.1 ribosomal protein L9 [Pyramidobacter piscolens W5455]BDF79163.1 50S ribosomal protein L9 [Pyramidobacter piscolens]